MLQSLIVLAMALVALGCGGEQERDRIGQALEQSFSGALVGCVPVAWERTQKLPQHRMGSCGTGRWQNNTPFILDALSHTDRVRMVEENQDERLGVYGNQYELVDGFPIATIESTYSTTTAVCWGDARVRVVDIGQDRMWKWDGFYDVAAAAGIDTLRIALLRKRHLSADIWYQMAVVPRPWAAQLEPLHLATLHRYSFRAPHAGGQAYLVAEEEKTSYVRKAIATYRDGEWTFRRYASSPEDIGNMANKRVTRGRYSG